MGRVNSNLALLGQSKPGTDTLPGRRRMGRYLTDGQRVNLPPGRPRRPRQSDAAGHRLRRKGRSWRAGAQRGRRQSREEGLLPLPRFLGWLPTWETGRPYGLAVGR